MAMTHTDGTQCRCSESDYLTDTGLHLCPWHGDCYVDAGYQLHRAPYFAPCDICEAGFRFSQADLATVTDFAAMSVDPDCYGASEYTLTTGRD